MYDSLLLFFGGYYGMVVSILHTFEVVDFSKIQDQDPQNRLSSPTNEARVTSSRFCRPRAKLADDRIFSSSLSRETALLTEADDPNGGQYSCEENLTG